MSCQHPSHAELLEAKVASTVPEADRQSHGVAKKERVPSPGMLWRIATNLRRLRIARGYSQMELARRTGLTNAWISKVEQGSVNPGIANLEALAQGLDCGVEDLVMKPPILVPIESKR